MPKKKGPKGGETTRHESGLVRKVYYLYEPEAEAIRRLAFERHVTEWLNDGTELAIFVRGTPVQDVRPDRAAADAVERRIEPTRSWVELSPEPPANTVAARSLLAAC